MTGHPIEPGRPVVTGREARRADPTAVTTASSPVGDARSRAEVRQRTGRLPVAGVGIAMLVGLVTVVLGWFRLPAITRDTMWAEDVRLFLHQRIVLGPWASLVQPYDGYQHLVPRILTDTAVLVAPIERYAMTVTLLALAAVGLTAAATFAFSAGLVRTRTARIALALIPVLLPISANEALGNLANLHWFALYLAPFILLHRPATRTRAVFQTVLVLLVAGTEIQTVVFVPLLALMLRRRRVWSVGIAYLVGLAGQFGALLTTPRVRSEETPVLLADAVRGFFAEPSLSLWVHDGPRAATLLAQHGVPVLAAAFAPFAVALVAAVAARWSGRSLLAVVLAVGAVAVWFADVLLNPNGLLEFSARGWAVLAAEGFVRYALVPSMFLAALLVVGADRLLAAGGGRCLAVGGDGRLASGADGRLAVGEGVRGGAVALRVVGVLVLVGLAGGLTTAYEPLSTSRSGGPDWRTSVRTAEQACASVGGVGRQRIEGAPSGWGVSLSCADIDGDRRFP
ncbi:hypothetical protein [Curtobacterium sp. Leaf261]|uniref:hypothetical protein n=1 Tax=Curtobacterium sp. Leaf261 TaxID=1736311 RepID=UPI0012E2B9C8|nr:hypothetical protein [Curtobacterium sp. Leaf261]